MAKPNPLKAASMAASVAESLGKAPESAPAAPPAPAPTAAASEEPASASTPAPVPGKTSREGKRFLGYYVEPQRHEEIKQAAMDESIQVQELMRRAIDDWMAQYGQDAVQTVAARHAKRRQRSN